MGSVLHRAGFRWTEYMQSKASRSGKHDINYMVLDFIAISMIILMVFMITVTITL